MNVDHLQVGTRYRVRYKSQAGNYQWSEWEFVGSFLGTSNALETLTTDWSMRPAAGTGSIAMKDILDIQPTSAEPSQPMRIGKYVS